jgi:hypothetical protein
MTRSRHPAPRLQAGIVALVLALVEAIAPPVARAQADEARSQEARAACAAGQVEKGITLLAELFASTGGINWVFNQGRCYQQNGRAEAAINRFKEYLRRSDVSETEKRAEAGRFIEELEADLRRARPPASSSEPAASERHPGVIEGPFPGQTAPGARTPLPAPPSGTDALSVGAESSSYRQDRRILFLGSAALAGAGLLALTGGIFSSVKVKSLANEAARWNVSDWNRLAERQQARANRYERLQWLGYGVAGLALAGSGLLFYLDMKGSGEAAAAGGGATRARTVGHSTVSFLPLLQPGGGGGQLSFLLQL